MQAIERMKAALELARASGSSAVPMNPEIVSEVLAHIDALEAENERLRKDAERNPIAEEDLLALFARVQPRLRFTDADIRPFASGAAAAEFFHGIKGTP